jgi:hypothetical protein
MFSSRAVVHGIISVQNACLREGLSGLSDHNAEPESGAPMFVRLKEFTLFDNRFMHPMRKGRDNNSDSSLYSDFSALEASGYSPNACI